ncbi:heavy metal translocatin [Lentithecium fluviatile CBS 122367]|uniref:Heavy metal translocatin n=1 Tax=Lentithecium fluviatile CBS 122367 TaxID=1168545 RepID=A0A6G1JIA0_9PLEO|nr:heavy metal translocatin [Lentithecium fluviatile CBS 122367]
MARSCCSSGGCCSSNRKEKEASGATAEQDGSSSDRKSSDPTSYLSPSPTTITTEVSDSSIVLARFFLTIEGLSCACCESGIAKAIDHISAVWGYQINLVLARVEIDLDVNEESIDGVKKKLNGATGYKFVEFTQTQGQVLELLVNDVGELRRAKQPRGSVSNTNLFRQHTVRIQYDAKQIGARDILDYYQELRPDQNIRVASPTAHPSLAIGAKQTKRASIIFLTTLAFTLPILVFAWAPVHHEKMLYEHISLALATVVQATGLREFSPAAFRSLLRFSLFSMDLLVTLSTTIAYVFSVVSYVFQVLGRPLETGCFFETSTLLVTLILLGRVVVEAARYRAAKSVSFRSLQVENALLVVPGGSANAPQTEEINARLLQYGDRFKVPPHTRIVTDGTVSYGGSEVDESMITGESIPVAKGHDSPVYAGTINGRGTLVVSLTALPHENSISKIATLVENAELTKPKTQALADHIAGWFVPAIATIGLLAFLIWLFVDHYHNNRSWAKAVVRAMTYAIATLIVSCPCAIGLAVPMVILISGGVSARFGIIFRDPQKLEIARKVTDVVFDKTGTLTTGHLTVIQVKTYHGSSTDLVRILLGLMKNVKHPVSVAVYEWAKKKAIEHESGTLQPVEMLTVNNNIADGVEGKTVNGVTVRAGNPKWLGVHLLEADHTLLCVTIGGIHQATFRLKDRIRNTAKPVVKYLQDQDIAVHMLSGDNQGAVNAVAFTLGIAPSHAQGSQRPADKQRYIQYLQDNGNTVMFVGDGTNDAVALKQADVGVHLQHGCDVAKSAADIVLMNPQLHDLLTMLDISRAAYRRIILNFVWSALYNVVAILMAAGAFVKIRIDPAYAGLGELVSVLPVVLIAFQMKWRRYGREYRKKEWESLDELEY